MEKEGILINDLHPLLIDENYAKESGKCEMLLELVSNAVDSGHRILVFSQFTSMLAIIRKKLDELGIKEKSDIKSAAFFHIPLDEQREAWYEYANNGFEDTENAKLVYGVAGEGSKIVYSGVGEDELFETMLELGSTKAVFCGHDHYNNFSIDYKGIRLTYGMSVDYLAYPGIYKIGSQRGCTVINFAPDGSFESIPESYYQDKYESLYEKENVEMQEITQVAPPEAE